MPRNLNTSKSESCTLSNKNLNSFKQLKEFFYVILTTVPTWTIFLGNNLAIFQSQILGERGQERVREQMKQTVMFKDSQKIQKFKI